MYGVKLLCLDKKIIFCLCGAKALNIHVVSLQEKAFHAAAVSVGKEE